MTFPSGEEKPSCLNCQRQGETCDYAIRLNWDGRSKRKEDGKPGGHIIMFGNAASEPRVPPRSSPPKGASRHKRSPLPEAEPFIPSVIKTANQKADSVSPPPARPPASQLSDRRELLSPFSTVSPSMRRPRPYSAGIDNQSHSPSNEFSSSVLEAAQSMATSPQVWYSQRMTAYPSPIESAFDARDRGSILPTSSATTKRMPPPYSMSGCKRRIDHDASPEQSAKRVRLSPGDETSQSHDSSRMHRASSHSPGNIYEHSRPGFQLRTPRIASPSMTNPMTPASSSSNSDEIRRTWRPASSSHTIQDQDVRRVSVSSLLSGSPEPDPTQMMFDNPAQSDTDPPAISPHLGDSFSTRNRLYPNTQLESYGLDRGLPDLDIPRNDDAAAINGVSPFQQNDFDAWLANVDLGIPEFGFGLQKRELVLAKGGYYDSPVPIKIARTLEPLPSTLLENPMNLLYFHHFLNHTARILVVHDCSQNPFRTILPQSKVVRNCDLLASG